ncbi:MAG: hydrogenase maturation protease [Acidobacteriota bacterium]|nr:hydrogenase maturation protease [Acidobacteriota bacterium]
MAALIIGCGTWDRGDDAAGLLAVRLLRERGVDAREHTGDGLALIQAWQGAAEVILIDAVLTGSAAGTISRWDGSAPVRTDTVRASSHAFGVAEAVQLARALGKLPPRFLMYGIEACNFRLGTAVSSEVAAAARALADRLSARPHGHS